MTAPEPNIKQSNQLVILSQEEFEDPVLQYVIAQLGWATADFCIVEDFVRPENLSRAPVNTTLWPMYAALEAAKNYSNVLVTLFRGIGYYLLLDRPQDVHILPYSSHIVQRSIGVVPRETVLAEIELEEYLLDTYRDRFLCLDDTFMDVFDHKTSTVAADLEITNAPSPADILQKAFFVFLPHPKTQEPLTEPEIGMRICQEDYISWVSNSVTPDSIITEAVNRPIIIVDEGNDPLGLVQSSLDQGHAVWGIRAYDQRKPKQPASNQIIPAISSKRYFSELLNACHTNRYIGYGVPNDFTLRIAPSQDQPVLSVIVVYHNRPTLIAELLTAFASQTRTDFEIIIVDNGSDADIDFSENTYPFGLSYLRNMNAYPGHARNIGARLANADLLVFFDDDNLPLPHFVEDFVTAAHGPENFDLVLCLRHLFLDHDGKITSRGTLLSAPHLKYANAFRNYMGDNVFVIRKSVFFDILYSDFFEVGREDIEFLQYARDQGYSLGILIKDLYFYRLSNTDKIGNSHLTHTTKTTTGIDFGAYRKYFRSTESLSERKFKQIIDNSIGFLYKHKVVKSSRISRKLFLNLRARLSKIGLVRRIYYTVFR